MYGTSIEHGSATSLIAKYQLDNTCSTTIVMVFILLERVKTTSVRQNRHRSIEISSPQVEALPEGVLQQIADLLDSPSSGLVRNHGDAMDTGGDGDGGGGGDGTARNVSQRCSATSPHIADQLRQVQGRRRAAQSNAATAANVVPDDTTNVPSLRSLFFGGK